MVRWLPYAKQKEYFLCLIPKDWLTGIFLILAAFLQSKKIQADLQLSLSANCPFHEHHAFKGILKMRICYRASHNLYLSICLFDCDFMFSFSQDFFFSTTNKYIAFKISMAYVASKQLLLLHDKKTLNKLGIEVNFNTTKGMYEKPS